MLGKRERLQVERAREGSTPRRTRVTPPSSDPEKPPVKRDPPTDGPLSYLPFENLGRLLFPD